MSSPSALDLPFVTDEVSLELDPPLDLARYLGHARVTVAHNLHSALDHGAASVGLEALRARESAAQRWTMPQPVTLRLVSLEPSRLVLRITTLGRAARRLAAMVPPLLAQRPLGLGRALHAVRRVEITPGRDETLTELAARAAGALEARGDGVLALELPVPFDTKQQPFALAPIVGGIAGLMTRWDLAERGVDGELGFARCKELAERAQAEAERAIAALPVTSELSKVDRGTRSSRSNRQPIRLVGWTGRVTLAVQGADARASLAGALPWLVALAVRGGRHRSFDMSEVVLRDGAGVELLPFVPQGERMVLTPHVHARG